MESERKITRQTETTYKISSKEIKRLLKIKGEIRGMSLFQGRSPVDEEQGISADEDIWEINTLEIEDGK
ncbi:MAG TPA: hypothetical protein VMZ91_13420 [Candidatus Paceibacterota bacterium]|nr:hypothetical protein [Candidatus Paceibacterota bacterium]